jgi:hypothetical protein
MNDSEPNIRALRREWLAARIMAGLGLLLLLAVVGVITATEMSGTQPATAPPATAAAPDTAEARRAEDIALCDAALATAQGVGLVPGFATRDGNVAAPGDAQGRYVCRARTDAAKYTIAFDLACTHLGDAKCIVLYKIAQDGGGVLYQRR